MQTVALPEPDVVDAARLDGALLRFVAWLDGFGETSFDHQSYFAGPIGGRAKALYYRQPMLGMLAVAPMILSEAFLPSARQLFWKKQRFPIADAHYAMGFTYVAQCGGDSSHYGCAVHFLEVLEQTRCPGYRHAGWGYPFDWVTRNGVMKAQTPLITSTPYVYEAFAAVHRIDGDLRWLRTMESAAQRASIKTPALARGDGVPGCVCRPRDTEFHGVDASTFAMLPLTSAAAHSRRAKQSSAAPAHSQRHSAGDRVHLPGSIVTNSSASTRLAHVDPYTPEGLCTAPTRHDRPHAQGLPQGDG